MGRRGDPERGPIMAISLAPNDSTPSGSSGVLPRGPRVATRGYSNSSPSGNLGKTLLRIENFKGRLQNYQIGLHGIVNEKTDPFPRSDST